MARNDRIHMGPVWDKTTNATNRNTEWKIAHPAIYILPTRNANSWKAGSNFKFNAGYASDQTTLDVVERQGTHVFYSLHWLIEQCI